jgi:acyl-CoA hydrolase
VPQSGTQGQAPRVRQSARRARTGQLQTLVYVYVYACSGDGENRDAAPVYPAPMPDLPAKKPSASVAVMSELMMPHQVNNLGHVFGGELLSMVDRAAAVAAMRHAGKATVTVSIDRVDFREPIYTGELVTCTAQVNFVGRTSMEIGVRVEAENLLTGEKRHTNTCFLTFVAIDENHRPFRVPPLDLADAEDERRFREGKRRREVREALDRELDGEQA